MLVVPQLRCSAPCLSHASEWDQCGICGEQSGTWSIFLFPPYRRPPLPLSTYFTSAQYSSIHKIRTTMSLRININTRRQSVLQAVFRTLPLRANAPNLLPARKCEQFAVTARRQKRGQGQLLKEGSRLRVR